jgi:spore coat protein U-like protein
MSIELNRRLRGLALASLCAGMTLAVTPSASLAAESAQLVLHGTIEPRCGFTSVPQDANLGVLATGAILDIGQLTFSCNLAESTAINLTIQSTNGALQRDGGSEQVAYAAAWAVQGDTAFYNMADYTGLHAFTLQSGAAGSQQGGTYRIQIVGSPDGLVAGTYRDTITYTISP